MPFKLAIASGKGGTGKTTLSVLLYTYFKKNICDSIDIVDCDVEEPNVRIFLPDAPATHEHTINQKIPQINTETCTFCKKCVAYCEFNAISVIASAKYAQISKDLCHSCGACLVACEFDAITEYNHAIGRVNQYKTGENTHLLEGRLRIGSTMQTMLIRELKKLTADKTDFLIFDAPPGTTCPVVETLSDANFVILVAEPTPFGLHDLKLTIELIRDLQMPFGVVINKAGLGSKDIYNYLQSENIKLLGEIPFNRNYAQEYSNGNLINKTYNKVLPNITNIANHIKNELLAYERDNDFIR